MRLAVAPAPASAPAAARDISECRDCPRLVEWRERVAVEKRRMYRACEYWGRPVAGFGDPEARIVVVGLAPGAHGANRTGRVFTGDRSGDFLYAALHRAGLASQPTSVARDDGLVLRDAFVLLAVRCAPPGNAPRPDEIARCARFLDAEAALLPRARVAVALGAIAWRAWIDHLARLGAAVDRHRPRFAHGAEACFAGASDASRAPSVLLGSYHVSQQNTQTGRLTRAMFDSVIARATVLAERPERS
jgi:uracil-DNA glycosylase family 4